MNSKAWLSFTAVIRKVDINPCVAVPTTISQALGKRGFVPVELNLSGSRHLANLVPVGGGRHRLYINGLMLKATSWQVSDRVEIKLRYDPKTRVEPANPALAAALKKHPSAQAVFDSMPPSHQKEFNRYLNNLKSADTLNRQVTKVIDGLEGKKPHMLVRNKTKS